MNTGESIGGRNRTLVTRVWNPVRNHCAPTWETGKEKGAACAGCPAQTAPGRLSREEITQVGRPHSGSARPRAGGRRRLHARIAGMPTKPWGLAAMSFPGSACRTRCLLGVVVRAGISLTHPARSSQRISRLNCSPVSFPAHPTYAATLRFHASSPRSTGTGESHLSFQVGSAPQSSRCRRPTQNPTCRKPGSASRSSTTAPATAATG